MKPPLHLSRPAAFQLLAFLLPVMLCFTAKNHDYVGPIVCNLTLLVTATLIFAVISPVLVIRLIFKWCCGEHWNKAYVRQAVDASLTGMFVLFLLTINPDYLGYGHMPEAMQHQIRLMLNRTEQNQIFYPQSLKDAHSKLHLLTSVSWFIDHFSTFVILPGGVIFLIGYGMATAKSSKPSGPLK